MIFFQAILCICKCCFWCLEKFMKFINRSVFLTKGCWFIKYFRNAYILTASQGTNFCRSAKQAFGLIFRNMVSNQRKTLKSLLIIVFQGTGGSSWQGDRLPALRWETRRHRCRRPYFLRLVLWRHQWAGKSHNKQGPIILIGTREKILLLFNWPSLFIGPESDHWRCLSVTP